MPLYSILSWSAMVQFSENGILMLESKTSALLNLLQIRPLLQNYYMDWTSW